MDSKHVYIHHLEHFVTIRDLKAEFETIYTTHISEVLYGKYERDCVQRNIYVFRMSGYVILAIIQIIYETFFHLVIFHIKNGAFVSVKQMSTPICNRHSSNSVCLKDLPFVCVCN